MGLSGRPPVEIVGPLAAWPDDFRAIGEDLRRLLGAHARRIDHIGSTSVPGLAAKDVIDVQVTVASLEPWAVLATAFARGGYVEADGVARDHRPPWGAPEEDGWRKRLFHEARGGRHAHIHVREQGRANQRYALLFRDYLRVHRHTATAYEAVKRGLAERFRDERDVYAALKDPVCDLMVDAAERWAAANGWEPPPSDA